MRHTDIDLSSFPVFAGDNVRNCEAQLTLGLPAAHKIFSTITSYILLRTPSLYPRTKIQIQALDGIT